MVKGEGGRILRGGKRRRWIRRGRKGVDREGKEGSG